MQKLVLSFDEAIYYSSVTKTLSFEIYPDFSPQNVEKAPIKPLLWMAEVLHKGTGEFVSVENKYTLFDVWPRTTLVYTNFARSVALSLLEYAFKTAGAVEFSQTPPSTQNRFDASRVIAIIVYSWTRSSLRILPHA